MSPRFAICELILPGTTFEQDLKLACENGVEGISIVDGKIANDQAAALTAFRESGLQAAACCPTAWSILPLGVLPEPRDPRIRIEQICTAVERLVPYQPDTIFCATGWSAEMDERAATDLVVGALRDIADLADQAGLTISIEPMTARHDPPWSLVTSIEQTVRLIDATGRNNLRVIVDIWHLFDTPGFHDQLRRHIDLISAVQVSDYRLPQTFRDRLYPGDGEANIPAIFAILEEAGYSGFLDLEVFSDTLQKLSVEEFVHDGVAGLRRCWDQRVGAAG